MSVDQTKLSTGDAGIPGAADEVAPAQPPAATRQCSRCRATYPSDPTLFFTAQYAWWLCPLCEEKLLGADRLRGWRAEPSATPVGE
jgi:hypothetical protein